MVDGLWSTACIPRQDLFASYRIELDFQKAQDVTRTEYYAMDATCAEAVATLQYRGDYELIVTGRDFTYAIDFSLNEQSLVALHSSAQQRWEEAGFCGQQLWPLTVAQHPLTFDPGNCTAVGPVPLNHLNLVSINRGFSLNFGSDLAHDNERPVDVVISPELVFLSQPSP
ncbi:MAG TPA: hypothetical protein VE954_36530 [Oligoflexus sp.]|uniref:hypothetical protein n=1 Tax=Oligoflexus sp. TaxID=1971216 RepID=UPI002D2C87D1|nr:hypothetical protein [Oligoflexus sp.]HYX38643.1 hypothetical protein [Oligoflexus sp.]